MALTMKVDANPAVDAVATLNVAVVRSAESVIAAGDGGVSTAFPGPTVTVGGVEKRPISGPHLFEAGALWGSADPAHAGGTCGYVGICDGSAISASC